MKVGVVGISRMGKHHIRNFYRLKKEGLLELVAISDIDPYKKN
jgi:predicted dehydrogenase